MSLFLGSLAYANHSMGGGHSMGGHGYGKGSQCPVADTLLMKSHFLLEHQTDFALTDEQVKAIKDIKLQAQKDSLRQSADREIFMLDLRSKLEEDKVDAEGAKVLIDKAFASMITDTKSNVDAYAKLQSVLTPDQVSKVKNYWKSKKESWKHEAGSAKDKGEDKEE